ncbi:DUF805 domain-containing protein [Leuconostocaceae bacterium ESL0958]|nr:DUF805 domain-containing protein [Leuconostocaceae bacterium ESL0958]
MWTAYKKFWKNYATFSGRASRSDFWLVVLMHVILGLIWLAGLAAAGFSLLWDIVRQDSTSDWNVAAVVFVIAWLALLVLYLLATIIPALSLEYRRFADTGLRPWWFIVLLPLSYVLDGMSNSQPDNGLLLALSAFLGLVIFIINLMPTDKFRKG